MKIRIGTFATTQQGGGVVMRIRQTWMPMAELIEKSSQTTNNTTKTMKSNPES